ncbi:MAG: DUF973 family protein [Pyrinomonadaceae bacterium]
MKIAGIVLFLIGSVVLLIGLAVCITTLTSDYASLACERAAKDQKAISDARARCAGNTECFRQAIVGLTTQDDCDQRKSFMNKQLVMGIVPAVIGGVLAFIGLLLTVFGFVRARRNRQGPPLASS